MDDSNPTNIEITDTLKAIEQLKARVAFGKKFKELYADENFQMVIMDTMLGDEVNAKARSLALDPYMDSEQEEEALVVLRSMRYLNQFIQEKLRDAEIAPAELAMNEDYLQQLVVANKD